MSPRLGGIALLAALAANPVLAQVTCPSTPDFTCDGVIGSPSSKVTLSNDPVRGTKLKLRLFYAGPSGEFGDPTTRTEYAVCLYHEGVPPELFFSAIIPAGGTCGSDAAPCWKSKATGFIYKDTFGQAGGITKARVMGGGPIGLRQQLKFVGKNVAFDAPDVNFSFVYAQINTSDGLCWEASFLPLLTSPTLFKGVDS